MINNQEKLDHQRFIYEVTQIIDKMEMSWDDELNMWYKHAIKALEFCVPNQVGITEDGLIRLFDKTDSGINMNVFAALSNNINLRTAHEMQMPTKSWAKVLALNFKLQQNWNLAVEPIRQQVKTRIKINSGVRGGLTIMKGDN